MNKPKVSIIIPTLNRKEVFFETLESLKGQTIDNFEIIIVDQNDQPLNFDGVSLKNKINHVHLERKNLPNARNVGAKEAKAEILIYIDDDVKILSDNFIKSHLEAYKNGEVGLVAGRVIQSYESEQETVNKVGRISPHLLIIGGSFNSEKNQLTTGVIGCNFSCRKRVWKQVGGFDPDFDGTANMEESDFTIKVRKKGWKALFKPEAKLKHFAEPTGGVRSNTEEVVRKRYWIFYNYVYLFQKHGNGLLWPLFLVYLLARGFYYSFKDKSIKIIYSSCIKGIIDRFFKKNVTT